MNIQITDVSLHDVCLMKREGFIAGSLLSDPENDLYTVVLADSVIFKASYNITLDKGGKLFTLYNTEFSEVTIT